MTNGYWSLDNMIKDLNEQLRDDEYLARAFAATPHTNASPGDTSNPKVFIDARRELIGLVTACGSKIIDDESRDIDWRLAAYRKLTDHMLSTLFRANRASVALPPKN
jgi:hypothetical protein